MEMKSVPISPTPEMLEAGAKMYKDCLQSAACFEHHAFRIYCAMIDAAPATKE